MKEITIKVSDKQYRVLRLMADIREQPLEEYVLENLCCAVDGDLRESVADMMGLVEHDARILCEMAKDEGVGA